MGEIRYHQPVKRDVGVRLDPKSGYRVSSVRFYLCEFHHVSMTLRVFSSSNELESQHVWSKWWQGIVGFLLLSLLTLSTSRFVVKSQAE